jgi:outer membrane protein OmpA-like peptidoglycan-associated protein
VDFNQPELKYEEVTDKDINVRGNDQYAIYTLNETVLFGSGDKNVEPKAADKLEQVAASLQKRFKDGQVRIYGFADYNKELAEKRAESVKSWLIQKGKVSGANLSMHSMGESQPAASNATSEGREQNRRVQIVARHSSPA